MATAETPEEFVSPPKAALTVGLHEGEWFSMPVVATNIDHGVGSQLQVMSFSGRMGTWQPITV